MFGPGHGEAIVVFLPDGSVGVVDGCKEPTKGRGDPVRELLNEYEQVVPNFRVRFVCLTHPHADHYAGLGRLMAAYEQRIESAWETPVTEAYRTQLIEYAKIRAAGRSWTPKDEEDIKGIERVFNAFRKFRVARRPAYRHISAGTTLFEDYWLDQPVQITGWAAHANDVAEAMEDLVCTINAAATDGIAREHDRNRVSGAVSITWGKAGVLLAGDTLLGRGKHVGWSGAYDLAEKHPIQVVNVAHHASAEAHDVALWAKMSPELAIVTPFHAATGGNPPQHEQLKELAKSCVVTITATPQWARVGPEPGNQTERSQGAPKAQMQPEPTRAASHAVGVSLDPDGNITKFLLAKGANVFR